jgi:hypothetical protein
VGTDSQPEGRFKASVGEEFVHPQMVEIAKRRTKFSEAISTKHAMRIGLILAFIAVIASESAFSTMELITPIDQRVLWGMRLLGLLAGIAVWWLIRSSPSFDETSRLGTFSLALMVPLFGLGLFDALTWRAAVWWEFGLSSAPLETTVYPISGLDSGRRSARTSIEIDPFGTGQELHIPIPKAQFHELRYLEGPLCVLVRQHRSESGAIEVLTDGRHTLAPPTRVSAGHCDEMRTLLASLNSR